jgi:hypothetical protein
MADSDHDISDDITKARGTGFPTLSLPEAVEIIERAGTYGRQHSMNALASYAGHATANSGPFRRKLAALKDWGLIVKDGAGVAITPIGMEIAHPASAAGVLDRQIEAFQKCTIFWKLYQDAAKGTPLTSAMIANTAINNYGIGVQSKDKFVKSFIDSAVAVGLGEKLPSGDVQLADNRGVTRGLSTELDTRPLQDSTGMNNKLLQTQAIDSVTSADVSAAVSGLLPVVQQEWANGGAMIRFEIRSKQPLPSAAFAGIGEAVTGIEALWDVLKLYNEEAADQLGQP